MVEKFLNEYEKPIRSHYIILSMSWAGWLFDFYDLMLFSFLLIPIKKDLLLNDVTLSFLLGASLASTAIGGIIFGFLADIFGRKKILSITILVYSIGTFLCGFSTSWISLLVFRIITGFGVGGEWATGQTLIGETFPPKMRARFAAIMQTGAPLGIALASIIGGFIAPSIGWRITFFISVLPALLVVFIRIHMPESDIWLAGKGKRKEKKREFNLSLLTNDGTMRRWFIIGLVLALTDMSAYWFTYSWMPKYLYDKLGFSTARSGIWMLVTQAGGFLGYLSFGFFADKKGRRITYTAFSFIWAIGLLLITWFWGWLSGILPAVTLICMFLVGFGTGNFSGYGPIFSELFPTKVRNTAMGSAFNLARGVQFFTPIIITAVASHYGLGGGISLAALFAIFTGLWVWLLPETKGKIIKE